MNYTLLPDPQKFERNQMLCKKVVERLEAHQVRWISVETREDAADRIFIITIPSITMRTFSIIDFGPDEEEISKIESAGFKVLRNQPHIFTTRIVSECGSYDREENSGFTELEVIYK